MPHTTRLLFVAGSARKASLNKRLARLGAEIANANGIRSAFADLGDYPMPLYDGDLEAAEGPPENAHKLKALFEVHHGIFIVSPEYNASIPPLLKNAIDWVSRIRDANEPALAVFKTRVFALGSASPGAFGGIRGLTVLRQTLEIGTGALVLPDQFSVPRANTAFGDNGHLADKAAMELYKGTIEKLARASLIMRQEVSPS
jgi:chromate reductase, NAD(P)H dehydrogenase (quinone)